MSGLVLALDPGRQKIGAALLTEDGELLRRAVLSNLGLEADLTSFLGHERGGLQVTVVGDGTTSDALQERLANLVGAEVAVAVVDERESTLEARTLFYRENPPSWPVSWLPSGLWPEPDMPLDGFAAEVLGRRWLAQHTRAAR